MWYFNSHISSVLDNWNFSSLKGVDENKRWKKLYKNLVKYPHDFITYFITDIVLELSNEEDKKQQITQKQ